MSDRWQELRRLVGSLKADDQEDWRLDIANIFGGCSTDEDVALVEYLGKYILPHRRVSEQAKDLLAERDALLAENGRLRSELGDANEDANLLCHEVGQLKAEVGRLRADMAELVEALNRYREASRAGSGPLRSGRAVSFRAAADQIAAAYEDMVQAHIKAGGMPMMPPPTDPDSDGGEAD